MKTLFLAWQAARPVLAGGVASRAWYPIGRLDAAADRPLFRFGYTQGARRAQSEAGFAPLEAFPRLEGVYEDDELFPLFQNRLMSQRRGDYRQYVERLALDPDSADPIEVLALSEGRRETDHLEVFPMLPVRRDGSFTSRFFLHGWRHVNAASQVRLKALTEGEALQVALELNNPATGAAVQIETANDYHMLGWAPRYLVTDLLKAMAESPGAISARVLRLNPEPAPANQRVLVELTGRFAEGYRPMSGHDFQPLGAAEPALH
jgi:hypothetical protein